MAAAAVSRRTDRYVKALAFARLALRELEAFPSAGLAGFFSFFHPGIAPEQSFRFERSAKIRVHQQEGPRDGEPRRARLAGSASARGVD